MINFYLDCCKKDGKKPERRKIGQVKVELPLETYLGVSNAAEETGRSIADLVVSAVKIAYPYNSADVKTERRRKRTTAAP